MAVLIGLIVGALIGGVAFGSAGAAIGGFVGFFVGAVISSRRDRDVHRSLEAPVAASPVSASATEDSLEQKMVALERRVSELERMLRIGGAVAAGVDHALAASAPTTEAMIEGVESAPLEILPPPMPPVTAPASDDAFARAPDGTLPPLSIEPRAAAGVTTASAIETSTFDASGGGGKSAAPVVPNPLWAWMVGGNTLARIGVLLLFIGVGFLLKYAVEHVYVPISVRLAGVALGGVVLLVLGWRLRHARRAYAMVLQGGGVGVLYLTVFAALRLYALVSPIAAFLLLLWISV